MSFRININDIYNMKQTKQNRDDEIYEDMLKICYNRIKLNVERGGNSFIFKFPIKMGVPIYRTTKCANYIKKDLEENGYHVRIMAHNCIFISWVHVKNIEQKKLEDKKSQVIIENKIENPKNLLFKTITFKKDKKAFI